MDVNELIDNYLRHAEGLFGPRATSCWKFAGVEFNDYPPHLRYLPDSREAVISLSHKARNNELAFRFELSHEACHLLYPAMNEATRTLERHTVLNEGISVWFSLYVVADETDGTGILKELIQGTSPYSHALRLVSELMEGDPDAIRKLRAVEPFVNRLEARHFDVAGVVAREELKVQLLKPFN